jgi:aminopeptidase N
VRPEIYHEINNFYTSTVYEKGAELVRMIKTLLGLADFRKGMDLYFERHDGEAATVEQFIACFAQAGRRDMSQFMLWYSQAGTPEVIASGNYDTKSKTFRLELAQTIPATPGQPDKSPAIIPLAFGLVGRDGRDLPLHLDAPGGRNPGVIELTQAAQTHTFNNVPERPVPSLNRGFSAPIKLVANLSAADLRHLAAHDFDPVNRWQALQTLATRMMVANTTSLRSGGGAANDAGLIEALRAIVSDKTLEPAYVAQALTIPSETDIAREIGQNVDPDAIFKARRHLRAEIGRSLDTELKSACRAFADSRPYRPDAASAGRRALKNVALDLLAATGAAEAIERASAQFQSADNMTDRMAAMSTLSLYDVPQRSAALESFYQRYASDPLVIDKWFALQAAIPESGTLDRVRALTGHSAFSIGNPNRVRALIGAFAQGNATQFNRADGAGYDFTIENVLAIDPRNPQLAARLMTAFRSWRALEQTRRTRAEAALRRLAEASSSLSVDVRDIVSRALADEPRS